MKHVRMHVALALLLCLSPAAATAGKSDKQKPDDHVSVEPIRSLGA